MSELARGVSHDVNNALGSMLPLVQQMQADLKDGTMNPETFSADLEQVHSSLQVARRIFSGMLSFARRAAREAHQAQIARAVEGVLDILRDGIERRGVRIISEIPADLPPIDGDQGQVEQLLLNLITNARDAMQEGGRLTVREDACRSRARPERERRSDWSCRPQLSARRSLPNEPLPHSRRR